MQESSAFITFVLTFWDLSQTPTQTQSQFFEGTEGSPSLERLALGYGQVSPGPGVIALYNFLKRGVKMPTEILQELKEIKQLLALNKKMWTLEDFCAYTGLSKQYAYHLTSTGKVKFSRPFGKMIFFDSDEVIEFLKQNPSMGAKESKQLTDKYLLNH